jgi:hypothetical protein
MTFIIYIDISMNIFIIYIGITRPHGVDELKQVEINVKRQLFCNSYYIFLCCATLMACQL